MGSPCPQYSISPQPEPAGLQRLEEADETPVVHSEWAGPLPDLNLIGTAGAAEIAGQRRLNL